MPHPGAACSAGIKWGCMRTASKPEIPVTAAACSLLTLFLLIAAACPAMSAEQELFDFHQDGGPRWHAINDGVMGGVSQGRARITGDGVLVFSGVVSLENNGGFASIRSEPSPLQIRGARGIKLRSGIIFSSSGLPGITAPPRSKPTGLPRPKLTVLKSPGQAYSSSNGNHWAQS